MKRIFRICRILLKGRLALTKVISKRIAYELILNKIKYHINIGRYDIKMEQFTSLLSDFYQAYLNELRKFKFKTAMKAYYKKLRN